MVKAANPTTYTQSDPRYYVMVLELLKTIEKDYEMKSIKEIVVEDMSERPVQTLRDLLKRVYDIVSSSSYDTNVPREYVNKKGI